MTVFRLRLQHVLLLSFGVIVSHITVCNTIKKNPETDIGVQPEGQEAKQPAVGSYRYLSPKMAILPAGMRLCQDTVLGLYLQSLGYIYCNFPSYHNSGRERLQTSYEHSMSVASNFFLTGCSCFPQCAILIVKLGPYAC